ncbi:MAG: hypothetical protein KatS3mg088_002 [Patescibacteria group bacterium]|nr:MAG: hypothetical protein KatS3mg088_002 [Patescibacteria group bacterium]
MLRISKDIINSFNNPDTLGIISSYPAKNGEVARDNAVSRYTYLLTKNFSKSQKVVIFCESRKKDEKPFLRSPNILVVPTYKVNSLSFFVSLLSKINEFSAIKDFLVQFEFSVFGGKVVIPQFLALLVALKVIGKSTKVMFHQVVNDINVLSGHLAIKRNGFKSLILNYLLRLFYTISGLLVDKVFVHDEVLADRIRNFVNETKIRIIPHGIDKGKKITSKFSRASKKYFGIDENAKVIGIFGYCSWYKGTDWLIRNFARFVKENPRLNIRLLVAGGESPTLKGTIAYRKYYNKLMNVIKRANGSIVYTGYVPDCDVKRVFAAVDLFVFPYRAKMSASGAFSLCLGYGKPYIVSRAFSENISKDESGERIFDLNYTSFKRALKGSLLKRDGQLVSVQCRGRSWEDVSLMYLKESLSVVSPLLKINYALLKA